MRASSRVRVLVAEDVPTSRALMVEVLNADAEVEVVGAAGDGAEAVRMTRALRPDVVVMDIRMPEMNGFEATRQIMLEVPTPIVIVSHHLDIAASAISMNALRLGATTLLAKPPGPTDPDCERSWREFSRVVKAMSAVKVVRRREQPSRSASALSPRTRPGRFIAIGASTGGPEALHRILTDLESVRAPIVIAQHIARGFAKGLAAWLDSASPVEVCLAQHGERIRAGVAYLAPDDRDLVVANRDHLALLPPDEGPGAVCPSCDRLFESVGRVFGASAIGVVLTGMGTDGHRGLQHIRRAGGQVIAQNEATSVVHGMPRAAIDARVVDHILPLDAIAHHLAQMTSERVE